MTATYTSTAVAEDWGYDTLYLLRYQSRCRVRERGGGGFGFDGGAGEGPDCYVDERGRWRCRVEVARRRDQDRFFVEQALCALYGICRDGGDEPPERDPDPSRGPGGDGTSDRQSSEGSQQTGCPGSIPLGPVTISGSTTIGIPNISTTGGVSAVFGFLRPVVNLGVGVDITIGGPSPDVLIASPYIGFNRHLSIGTNLTPQGPKGLNIHFGVSLFGPPIGVQLPVVKPCNAVQE